MDTLYLLQFACFLFMFINILILGVVFITFVGLVVSLMAISIQ